MALLNAQGISALVVELLARSLVLPRTVARVPGSDFGGPNGATVTIRVPRRRTALEQATPGATITYADVDETPVSLTVHHLYDATRISDEDLRLTIEDFGRQISAPQAAAVAEGAEDELAAVMNGLTSIVLTTSAAADDEIDTATAHGFIVGDKIRFAGLVGGAGLSNGTPYWVVTVADADTFEVSATPGGAVLNFTTDITAGTVAKWAALSFDATPDPAADDAVVLAAREQLTNNDVPAGRRFLAVSPQIATRLLAVDKFSKVDDSGSPSALREAVLGRLYGLTVVESNGLDPGEGVAYHESAFAFATLSPALPQGASSAAAMTVQGIAARQVFDFDPSILSDVSVVSTFAGATLVDPDRLVKLDTLA